MSLGDLAAITFGVFGTVVEWRGSIIEEGERVWRKRGPNVDWAPSWTPGASSANRR